MKEYKNTLYLGLGAFVFILITLLNTKLFNNLFNSEFFK